MSADIELKWEWPADRAIEDRLLVKITQIKSQKPSFFRLTKSPSIAGNLPEPTIIEGEIISEDTMNGKSIMVIAPKLEVEKVEVGRYTMLGVVNSNTCICIIPIDSETVDLNKVTCP